MHVSEGILSPSVLVAGAALSTVGVTIGLKRTDMEAVPYVGLLSAAFFVASLVHVPIGPASVHLCLNGLGGLILGWQVFPAIFVGLLLQAILFQHGGLTTLGVNAISLAGPAVLCGGIFGWAITTPKANRAGHIVASFLCGALAPLLTSLLVAWFIYLTGKPFAIVAKMVVITNLPVMVVEGCITGACVLFISRVKPGMLSQQRLGFT